MINSAVVGFLIFSGAMVQLLGKHISVSRQHQVAFATILLFILGVLPQLYLPVLAPGIIFGLGMMLFTLHLSAYYSGTPNNSAHLYAVILVLGGLVLIPISFSIFEQWSILRYGIMTGVWLILLELEHILSGKSYHHSKIERNLLWVWFISAIMSLWEPRIQLLPDMFFLVLLLTHFERRWPGLSLPAPLIALYGMLIIWYGHYAMSGFFGEASGSLDWNADSNQLILVGLLVAVALVNSFRVISMTKRFLYLFLAQEIVLVGLGIGNMFLPSGELIELQRLLLFVALVGLFVMIESRENEGLNLKDLRGLLRERPRFSSSVILVSVFFAIYPTIYFSGATATIKIGLTLIIGVGCLWTFLLIRTLMARVNRDYRILRPSLSIWSTVVFTILWAAVVVLEIVSRSYFS